MLWDLQSNPAEQFYKCWKTAVKLVHGVPRSTYTYLVEGFLANDQKSLRNQVLSRYPGFYRKLESSPSKGIRMVSSDPRSTTCKNLRYLRERTGLDQPERLSSWRMAEVLPVQDVPQAEIWRLGLLSHLMEMKKKKFMEVQVSKRITAMLDSLCST
jgi:hypothetical protein